MDDTDLVIRAALDGVGPPFVAEQPAALSALIEALRMSPARAGKDRFGRFLHAHLMSPMRKSYQTARQINSAVFLRSLAELSRDDFSLPMRSARGLLGCFTSAFSRR